ncbi:glycine cleavage system aminomethyltransferase GcvT [Cyanobacterium aponinum FACHB-4101]|uniref:glycine cleavage system aminomethyltransferase GcvT n=1 Tax=Cyanobacterium aponinum TaxID=379064 RepID=UPI001680D0B5|nr:glycine cleavage system aminomethyltransferase GcvT [Cyanobacterium aponinum FACHB-4101]
MTQSSKLLRTPLYSLSHECKAKFTDFAGWEMALQYSGLKKEHQAVRESVGMFDISHMGKFFLEGKQLREKFTYLVPTDLKNLEAGKAQYTVLLNHHGGIIDDIIFYYQGTNELEIESAVLIVNAATKDKDWQWLTKNLTAKDVTLTDKSSELALIALQGKNGVKILNHLINEDLSQFPSFSHWDTTLYEEPVFIARTGYTGEDGFEIMTTPKVAQKLWYYFLDNGVIPCGLGARDTLRLEAAMCLYGQDMNEEITPIEAGLGWLINLDHDFIGKDIITQQKQEGVKKKLVALVMEGKYIARHGYPILVNGEVIGEITSGTLSPTLEDAIALGYVSSDYSKIGQKLEIEIRGKLYPAKIVKKPFYKRS